jgi:hypothetical protein
MKGYDYPWINIRNKICRELGDSSETYLANTLAWYSDIYKNDFRKGVAGIKATVAVSDSDFVSDILPLIVFGESKKTSLVIPSTRKQFAEYSSAYGDFLLRSYLWLASSYLQEDVSIIELVNFDKAKKSVARIRVRKSPLTLDRYVKSIVQCISNNVDYPSQTDACKTCPFKEQCLL